MITPTSDRRPGTARTSPAPTNPTRNTGQDGRDTFVQAPGAVLQPSEPRLNRIAQRAHEIYEARGGEHGKAVEDWLQAEREIDAAIETSRTDH
jgi:Protein of unknown function (DUF2934)